MINGKEIQTDSESIGTEIVFDEKENAYAPGF